MNYLANMQRSCKLRTLSAMDAHFYAMFTILLEIQGERNFLTVSQLGWGITRVFYAKTLYINSICESRGSAQYSYASL